MGFWDNKTNQRNFLIEFAKENNIVHPRDWAKISSQQVYFSQFYTYFKIHERKGGSILLKKHDYNIVRMLKNVFPGKLTLLTYLFGEQEIDSRWFSKRPPRSYWESETHRQHFLSELAVKCNIRKSSDWLRITTKQVSYSSTFLIISDQSIRRS